MAEEYSLNLGSEFRDLDERLKGDSTSLLRLLEDTSTWARV